MQFIDGDFIFLQTANILSSGQSPICSLVLNSWQDSVALKTDDANKFTNPFLSTMPHEVVTRRASTSCKQCQNENTVRRNCISRKGTSVGIGLSHQENEQATPVTRDRERG
uniref:Uncharacterized protein n=1 Tax=Nelumbo nucifera TaxID=4432 RepID=A0A822Y493_NELNU|nr:TPA_asm: hypothetical protein HUJ06_028281 [Nelumbo nucifera]